jgi:hypothetical protein
LQNRLEKKKKNERGQISGQFFNFARVRRASAHQKCL